MAVTPAQSRAFLAARVREHAARSTELRANAVAALPGLAAALAELGATRVWVFGSIVEGGFDADRSDIDLAVEGLPPARYFTALGELLMRAPAPVDLVAIEDAPESLRGHIRTAGELIWPTPEATE